MNPLKYIDLFAGCGGLSTGLHMAGWKGLFAVERNADAFDTLKANLVDNRDHFEWPAWLPTKNWDINELLENYSRKIKDLKGQVDLIVGGPPCQGFSMAGRRIEGDRRNTLVHSYLEFVKLVQPKAILFENVRGFTMKFKGSSESTPAYSKVVIEQLRNLGYADARGELIDMSDYGIPQRRTRFIVIATLEGSADLVFDVLEKKCEEFLSERGIPRKNGAKSAMSDLLRSHGETTCPDSKSFKAGISMRPTTGLQKHLRGHAGPHVPDSHRFVNHTKEVEDVFKCMLAAAPRNRCVIGEERLKYGLRKRSVTVMSPSEPSPTLTTIPDDLIHYGEPRVMTVRECARLQTFPDWFQFKGPYTTGGKQRVNQTPRYTQVGNAVPPLFAEMAGLALKEVFSKE